MVSSRPFYLGVKRHYECTRIMCAVAESGVFGCPPAAVLQIEYYESTEYTFAAAVCVYTMIHTTTVS